MTYMLYSVRGATYMWFISGFCHGEVEAKCFVRRRVQYRDSLGMRFAQTSLFALYAGWLVRAIARHGGVGADQCGLARGPGAGTSCELLIDANQSRVRVASVA